MQRGLRCKRIGTESGTTQLGLGTACFARPKRAIHPSPKVPTDSTRFKCRIPRGGLRESGPCTSRRLGLPSGSHMPSTSAQVEKDHSVSPGSPRLAPANGFLSCVSFFANHIQPPAAFTSKISMLSPSEEQTQSPRPKHDQLKIRSGP